jgi:flagellar biogenesis protein FliO
MISVIELLVRLVISMVAVMAVMGIAARLVRRRQNAGPLFAARGGSASGPANRSGRSRARKPRAVPPLEVLYRRPLSKGAAVSLVDAAGRTFLLGVTDHSVTLLAELPGPAAAGAPASPGQLAIGQQTVPPVNLTDEDEWQQTGRMPGCERGPAGAETSDNAWKLALDSLRERTVRK